MSYLLSNGFTLLVLSSDARGVELIAITDRKSLPHNAAHSLEPEFFTASPPAKTERSALHHWLEKASFSQLCVKSLYAVALERA
jgi:hypothetical protein